MPASRTSLECTWREDAKLATSRLALSAPAKAHTVTTGNPWTVPELPRVSANKAPTVAPAVVPTVSEVASGF